MKVKVLRAFLVGGEAQPIGTELDVSEAFAREMLHIGKVERVVEKPAAKPPEPPAAKPAPAKPAAKPHAGPMTSAASALVAGAQPMKDSAP